jgi:hypothetical protein
VNRYQIHIDLRLTYDFKIRNRVIDAIIELVTLIFSIIDASDLCRFKAEGCERNQIIALGC